MSKLRGYEIEEKDGEFFYQDNGQPTAETWKDRPCGHCGMYNTPEGHDACLGELPGVMNACCGHGSRDESYIQFENGVIVRGFFYNFILNYETIKQKKLRKHPASF